MAHGKIGPGFLCQVPGCHRPNSGRFGVYCEAHAQNSYRNGHPLQHAILKRDLNPFLDEAQAIIDKNRTNLFYDVLLRRWELMLEKTGEIITRYDNGKPVDKEQLKAAQCLKTLGNAEVTPEIVIVSYLALHLHREDNPGSYRSDQAFNSQVVLYLRKLSPEFADTYYTSKGGIRSRVYRAIGIRASAVMATWLTQVFGDVVVSILRSRKARREKENDDMAKLYDALSKVELD